MGCDIHLVLERKHNDKWVGVREMGYVPSDAIDRDGTLGSHYISFKIKGRDYNFFYGLAGVRGGDEPARDPNGFPDDASSLSEMVLGPDDADLHSHGFISLPELIPILAVRKYEKELGDKLEDSRASAVAAVLENKVSESQIVKEWIDDYIEAEDYGNYRVVFAFDN